MPVVVAMVCVERVKMDVPVQLIARRPVVVMRSVTRPRAVQPVHRTVACVKGIVAFPTIPLVANCQQLPIVSVLPCQNVVPVCGIWHVQRRPRTAEVVMEIVVRPMALRVAVIPRSNSACVTVTPSAVK